MQKKSLLSVLICKRAGGRPSTLETVTLRIGSEGADSKLILESAKSGSINNRTDDQRLTLKLGSKVSPWPFWPFCSCALPTQDVRVHSVLQKVLARIKINPLLNPFPSFWYYWKFTHTSFRLGTGYFIYSKYHRPNICFALNGELFKPGRSSYSLSRLWPMKVDLVNGFLIIPIWISGGGWKNLIV